MAVLRLDKDFLAAWPRGWEALQREYFQKHEDFLRWYLGPETDIEALYRSHWTGKQDEAQRLRQRIEAADLEALLGTGYRAAERLLRPRDGVDIYVFVGLRWCDAFAGPRNGRLVVGFSIEAWDDFGAIPAVMVHEYAHAVRFHEGETDVRLLFRSEDQNFVRLWGEIPLIEWMVDEGLATAAAAEATGGDAEAGFARESVAWWRAHEAELWQSVRQELDRPPGRDGYERYFGGAYQGDMPARTGYWLGLRLVQRYLEAHPEVDLAAAVRLPAAAFKI